jgi:hypothetical protein
MDYGDSRTEPTIFYHIFRPADIATIVTAESSSK